MPEWYVELRNVGADDGAPAEVAAACRLALDHVDELRTSYAAAWAPVTLTWRHTLPGDAFVGQGGTLWRITSSAPAAVAGQWQLDVAEAGEQATAYVGDPDEDVDVLCPVAERDAFVLLRAELGARLVGRKAA